MGHLLEARRRQIRAKGRPMLLRRVMAGQPPREVTLQGFPRLYRPDEIQGALRQGDQQIEILRDELVAAGWSDAPRNPDKLILDGGTTTVQGCRPVYVGAELLGYSVWIRG